jgi:transcriptional regulator with XRE-family HTH domain
MASRDFRLGTRLIGTLMSKQSVATRKPPARKIQRPDPKIVQAEPKPKRPKPRFVAIGARIRALREARHLIQADVAEHLGVTVGAVTQWELGYVRLSMTNLDELVAYLGTNREFILTGDERAEQRKAQDVLELEALRLLRRIPDTIQRMKAILELSKMAGEEVRLEDVSVHA